MFKGNTNIAIYLIGVVVMFVVLLVIGRDFIPFVFSGFNTTDKWSRLPNPSFSLDTKLNYKAELETNLGTFTIDLLEENSPKNVNNFVYLANLGYYNSTLLHRVIPNLLLQGGDRNSVDSDPSNDGRGYPGYFIEDEINWDSILISETKRKELEALGFKSNPDVVSEKLDKYSVAMSNDGANTNGSQFFVVTASFDDARIDYLNGRFTVIGKIFSGFDIIDKINQVELNFTDPNNPRPIINIIINKVRIVTSQK